MCMYINQMTSDYEWHPVNYHGENDIQAAMAENMNIILQRTIIGWSRLVGNVWSQQIVWSGSFTDFHGILEPSQDNSNNLNLIIFIGQHFFLHPHLREQYIACYGTSHPTAVAIAAVDSSPRVIIQVEMMQMEGDRLLCEICRDVLSNGEDAKQLPCNRTAFLGGFMLNLNVGYADINFSARLPHYLPFLKSFTSFLIPNPT